MKGRWTKFGRWFAAPSVLVALLALVLGGVGAMFGVLILLGGIGALLALWIWTLNSGLRSSPEIRLVDGRLVHDTNEVPIVDIEAWTTYKSTSSGQSHGPSAIVMFRIPVIRDGIRGVRPDGGPAFELVKFTWREMYGAELESVRDALEPLIASRWVPLEEVRSLSS